jgi:hypothetical protein
VTITFQVEVLDEQTHRYLWMRDDEALRINEVLQLWQHDHSFCTEFISSLTESPFDAFRWEMPAVSTQSSNRPFEFVLLDAPHLQKQADHKTFAQYFTDDDTRQGIVAFSNLGKDATLLVPSPRTGNAAYPHFATFMRAGPDTQKHALLRELGAIATERLNTTERPLWMSTAGGGVAWLHVRIAHNPKYYGYAPYRSQPPL